MKSEGMSKPLTGELIRSLSKCSVLRAENLLRNHNREQQQRRQALLGMGVRPKPVDLIS